MAWRRIDDKPLSEPMLTQFTDAYAAPGGDELSYIVMKQVIVIPGKYHQMYEMHFEAMFN